MTAQQFIVLLNSLTDANWHDLFQGDNIYLVDDQSLKISNEGSGNLLVNSQQFIANSAIELKDQIISSASKLLAQYYQSTPLSASGFKQQLLNLISGHEINDFISIRNNTANYTFFVEAGSVILEDKSSPRHAYGLCFKPEQTINEKNLGALFNQWIYSGEAYDEYLCMNVCRYNC